MLNITMFTHEDCSYGILYSEDTCSKTNRVRFEDQKYGISFGFDDVMNC